MYTGRSDGVFLEFPVKNQIIKPCGRLPFPQYQSLKECHDQLWMGKNIVTCKRDDRLTCKIIRKGLLLFILSPAGISDGNLHAMQSKGRAGRFI